MAENHLASVTTPNGADTYTYDPLDRRATIDGYRLGYIGQSDLVSYVTDSSNLLVKRLTYAAAGLPVLMTVSYGGAWHTYGYLYDGTGQIVGLVDDTTGSSTLGQEVVTYTYDAWGNLLSDTDTSGIGAATINPFLYKGYWYDWSTGLYDLNARYYNPVIGRFLSEDPAGPSVGVALSYNGYAYARNNPVNRVDPSGTASYNVYLMARFGIKERATNPTIPGWIILGGTQVALLVLSEGLAGSEEFAVNEGMAAAEGAGEEPLTDAQTATLSRLDNIVNDHLTEQDLSGALRDIQGDPVPRIGGGYYDHLDEVKNSLRGLYAVEKSLHGSLRNPNLDPAARAALESGLSKAQQYIGKINEILNGGK